jgi:murein tripeptide amidase MpaA
MIRIKVFLLPFALFLLTSTLLAQSSSQNVPAEWLTHAEATDYRETPRFNETVAFARRLDRASDLIRFTDFGRSPQGRALPLLIVARNNAFTPERARATNKIVVLVQACIHAGESDGKDAGLALLRDIAVTRTESNLLENVVILFIPIYNVDGHERFGPYNRINQNGPREMGWRATATNLNLNRDYMKADAPETRAWLRLWNEWSPDLFIDCHTTDGADFRYNITYQFEHHETVLPSVRDWSRASFTERIVSATEREGNLLAAYMEFRDNRDLTRGVNAFLSTPRFATGYVSIARNRPALLIESHMLKNYRSRVRGTYDLVRASLAEVNRDPEALRRAVRLADEQAQNRIFDAARQTALRVELTDVSTSFQFKGVESRRERSDVSGAERIIYGTEPLDITIPLFNQTRVVAGIAPPLAYIIPPQWSEVIERLEAHGIRMQRLAAETEIEIESYRFRDARWASAPFENRIPVTFQTNMVRERRRFPAGSIVISTAQPLARVAVHLLEPAAPDSFVGWGFFNSIFEQKEYAEDYVLERIAREMMEANPELRREFEARVASDESFASNPRARLRFFYERSPYADPLLNLYPVGRIIAPVNVRLID